MNDHNYRGPMRTPAPPRDLMDAMSAAHDNPVALAILNAQYRAWLRDEHGITPNRWDNE